MKNMKNSVSQIFVSRLQEYDALANARNIQKSDFHSVPVFATENRLASLPNPSINSIPVTEFYTSIKWQLATFLAMILIMSLVICRIDAKIKPIQTAFHIIASILSQNHFQTQKTRSNGILILIMLFLFLSLNHNHRFYISELCWKEWVE